VVSVGVGGPQESSEGRDDIISESDMGAMIATWIAVFWRTVVTMEFVNISMCGRALSGATSLPIFTRSRVYSRVLSHFYLSRPLIGECMWIPMIQKVIEKKDKLRLVGFSTSQKNCSGKRWILL